MTGSSFFFRFLLDWLEDDWVVLVDLPNLPPHSYHQFPRELAESPYRPDLILINKRLKIVKLLELTIPAECNLIKAKNRKTIHYNDPLDDSSLINLCRSSGWSPTFVSIEIGTLGCLPKDLLKTFFQTVPAAPTREKNDLLLRCAISALEGSESIFTLKDG
eukprot:Lithocolla_globosa_v1_NODE_3448_length_1666_cov_6.812539.p2 type:complete len:161 gc:universal NODE_3448_length_1666_cov_6.812539:1180-1662(+)